MSTCNKFRVISTLSGVAGAFALGVAVCAAFNYIKTPSETDPCAMAVYGLSEKLTTYAVATNNVPTSPRQCMDDLGRFRNQVLSSLHNLKTATPGSREDAKTFAIRSLNDGAAALEPSCGRINPKRISEIAQKCGFN